MSHNTVTFVVGGTIATAKVQLNYNCYNVYFIECLLYFEIEKEELREYRKQKFAEMEERQKEMYPKEEYSIF